MKAKLIPLFFDSGRDQAFDNQLSILHDLLALDAELLSPVALGSPLPEADAVIFPQLLGEGYRRAAEFQSISIPILVVTSEFGTLSMWDWELISYLRTKGVSCIGPSNLEETKMLCRGLGVRRQLTTSKFIVNQDNPGEGQQAPIFKRFYWWESECSRRMTEKFGITIEKRSFKELGQRARQIDDAEAIQVSRSWNLPGSDLSDRAAKAAARLYLPVNGHCAKVLRIVDEDANAIDARIPEGDVTLAKLDSTFDKMTVAEAILEGYAQFPNSDCRNGGIVRVADGRRLLSHISSHHYLVMTGRHYNNIKTLSNVFDIAIDRI